MQLTLNELEGLVREICKARRLPAAAEELMVADYVGAHREGKSSHGVAKLLLLDDAMAQRRGPPVVAQRYGALVGIEGNGSLGHEIAALGVELAAETAASVGVAAVALWDFSRYGRLKPIGEALVKRGFAAVITNGGGPAAIAPPGGKDPILGTNPLCLGVPGNPPFFADLATSERPWGAIRDSLVSGHPLPPNTFLNGEGSFTDDPKDVAAVIPFGGWKGFALASALELLTGALIAGKVGTEVEGQLDLAAWIIAIKADAFRPLEDVCASVSSLAQQISDALPPKARRVVQRAESVELADRLYEQLTQMAQGRSFVGFSNNLTD